MTTISFPNARAVREGWCVSHCPGYLDASGEAREWQIQRFDEDTSFDSDESAWEFVSRRAREGSDYHRSALDFVEQHSRAEFASIIDHCRRAAA